MEGRAWKGFGDWHYPGRSGNGWHGEQGMWWGVRETSWTSQTRGSNTECPPCRTPDRDRPRTARRAHTGAAGRTETRNEGHSRLAGRKAEPVACSVGTHLQLPSIPPCLERDGKRHGTKQHPQGIKGPAFPAGQGGSAFLWDDLGTRIPMGRRDKNPHGTIYGPASPRDSIPEGRFGNQDPHGKEGPESPRDNLGSSTPRGSLPAVRPYRRARCA